MVVENRSGSLARRILPRFISKPLSHKAHERIFSDRDLLFYWPYALGKAGATFSLVFIIPRSDSFHEADSLKKLPSGQYVAKNCTVRVCDCKGQERTGKPQYSFGGCNFLKRQLLTFAGSPIRYAEGAGSSLGSLVIFKDLSS